MQKKVARFLSTVYLKSTGMKLPRGMASFLRSSSNKKICSILQECHSFKKKKNWEPTKIVGLSLRKISFLAKIVDGFQPLIQLFSKKPSSQMFDWILNKLLVPDKSRDHGETDKKLVALPGNASIQPGSLVMVRSLFDEIYIIKIILLCQFQNFPDIINNSLKWKR